MNSQRIVKHLKRPQNLLYWVLCRFPDLIKSDKQYLKMRYSLAFGKSLDLENPKTYSEKLQWLKLYNRRPEYTTMVDKYAAKEYVANIIGKEHIIPTLAVYNSTREIDWDALPEQFVLKTTHDSGGIVICRDKGKLDKEAAVRKLDYALCHDNYSVTREWPYKNVPRRIIAEQLMESRPDTHDLPDYKFFCFDGEVKAMFIATDRQKKGEETKFDYFDMDFMPLPFRQSHPHATVLPEKPKHFEEMKEIAAKLSKGHPHVRVDLYEVDDNVFFGELTLFHFSGLSPFHPEDWDKVFGDMLTLPGERWGGVIIKFRVESEKLKVEFIEPELYDYKIFCFDGEPRYLYVASDRAKKERGGTKFDFFDLDFNHLPVRNCHPNSAEKLTKPESFDEMLSLARKLSKGIPHVRVDFYDVNGKAYWGELTFFSMSGFAPYEPEEWDLRFGEMLRLPSERIED